MEQVVFREDSLAKLATVSTYQGKLVVVHDVLKMRCQGIDRISVALYDKQTHSLKTFIASPEDESPLKNYEAALSSSSSLRKIAKSSVPRPRVRVKLYPSHVSRQGACRLYLLQLSA